MVGSAPTMVVTRNEESGFDFPEREPEKVAKLKLKGIDGRAPPGVELAA
uniref:Uncharacterized protein n=1 Tax=Trachymyrmex cornetzi TaxID=471704 RepID=A0A151J8G0_9HYME